MFQEAYFIFSVGNVKPIWQAQYPECWQVKPMQQHDTPHSYSCKSRCLAESLLKCSGKDVATAKMQTLTPRTNRKGSRKAQWCPQQLHCGLLAAVAININRLIHGKCCQISLTLQFVPSTSKVSYVIYVQNNVGCSETFLASLSYSQVAGLFLGMVVVGFTVDRIGRRAGSITTALIMALGPPPPPSLWDGRQGATRNKLLP